MQECDLIPLLARSLPNAFCSLPASPILWYNLLVWALFMGASVLNIVTFYALIEAVTQLHMDNRGGREARGEGAARQRGAQAGVLLLQRRGGAAGLHGGPLAGPAVHRRAARPGAHRRCVSVSGRI